LTEKRRATGTMRCHEYQAHRQGRFPLPAVAPWMMRGEAHETITAACHSEAVESRFAQLISAIGQPGNSNTLPRQARSGTTL
jgi:hypothetical protein